MILRKGYGVLKRLLHPFGQKVAIFLTFRCTYNCAYCTLKMFNGKMPKCDKELSFAEWKTIIENYPARLREVTITGGEPMLHKDFQVFVNWLLSRGFFVTVYSNLTKDSGLAVINSYRYRIQTTFHAHVDKLDFLRRLVLYHKRFRVDVDEIGEKAWLLNSRLKPFCTLESAQNYPGFFMGPDGEIFLSFWKVLERYRNEKAQPEM